MKILKQSKQALSLAIKIINSGGLIVCPTDTIYGFLADASNEKAVKKIYKIKKRPKSNPLPIFIKNIEAAKKIAFISAEQEEILNKKWPGKYTFILKRKKEAKLYGINKDTIALRLPEYKFLNDLLEKINKPLVQTSVNISNNPALTKVSDIIEQFNKFDVLVIGGENLKKSQTSKIMDLTKDKIIILRK